MSETAAKFEIGDEIRVYDVPPEKGRKLYVEGQVVERDVRSRTMGDGYHVSVMKDSMTHDPDYTRLGMTIFVPYRPRREFADRLQLIRRRPHRDR